MSGRVVADAEAVIKWLNDGDAWIKKGRALLAAGFSTKPTEATIDLSKIGWKVKGGVAASSSDPWAWAFAYNQDDTMKPETSELVEAIKQHGSIQVSGFEIKLGGRDGNLLNRRKLEAQP